MSLAIVEYTLLYLIRSLTILKKIAGEWFYHIFITTSHPAKKSHDGESRVAIPISKKYMKFEGAVGCIICHALIIKPCDKGQLRAAS